jgi:hypothetical protein
VGNYDRLGDIPIDAQPINLAERDPKSVIDSASSTVFVVGSTAGARSSPVHTDDHENHMSQASSFREQRVQPLLREGTNRCVECGQNCGR